MITAMAAATEKPDFVPNTPVAGYLIARDPLIVWGPNQPKRQAGPGTVLAEFVGNRRAYFLFALSSTREVYSDFDADIAEIARLRRLYSEHRHIALCNTRAEVERFAGHGVSAILCSALAFVDETRYVPAKNPLKEFDAIYNATLTPVKRHELCRDVESLGLMYHWFADAGLVSQSETLARYRAMLPRARFLNNESGEHCLFGPETVCAWINRARVGLCLSAREGAMLATIEYLLSGIPVVSTPSVGGRDRVLDPRFSLIVEPEPSAVADAVRTLAGRPYDPMAIRKAAFDAMREDRIRLIRLIEAIYREEAVAFPTDAPWLELYRRGAWPMSTIEKMLSSVPIAEMLQPATTGKSAS
jgi:glycosyltransferase involved in cell wall biosynthesis